MKTVPENQRDSASPPLASRGAGFVMQSGEGNNVALGAKKIKNKKIKGRNKDLAKRRQQDFNVFGKGETKRKETKI